MAAKFPIFIDISDKEILVYGAGTIATRRVKTLLRFEAKITVVAPEASDEIKLLAKSGLISYQPRAYEPGEIADSLFAVLATTDDSETNDTIYKEAKEKNILVNVASDKDKCDFHFPGVVKKDNIVVGVNAGGMNHKMAKNITRMIEGVLNQ